MLNLPKGEYIIDRDGDKLIFRPYKINTMFPRLADFKIFHGIKLEAVMYGDKEFTELEVRE